MFGASGVPKVIAISRPSVEGVIFARVIDGWTTKFLMSEAVAGESGFEKPSSKTFGVFATSAEMSRGGVDIQC